MAKKKSIRNRVIYQSEALFVSPNAAGAHFTCDAVLTGFGPTGNTLAMHGSISGNAPALMSLHTPVGLHQDPAITNLIPSTALEYGYWEWRGQSTAVSHVPSVLENHRTSSPEDEAHPGQWDLLNLTDPVMVEWLVGENGIETLNSSPSFPAGYVSPWPRVVENHSAPWQTKPASFAPNPGSMMGTNGDVAPWPQLYTHHFQVNTTIFPAVDTHGRTVTQDSGFCYVYYSPRKWDEAYAKYYQNGSGPDSIPDKNVVGVGILISPFSGSYKNLVQQVHRVQSANYGYTINRTDVNVYGQLARIDAIALEPPTVNLDLTYFPTDGFNERNLGLYLQGEGSGVGMGTEALNASTHQLGGDFVGQYFLPTDESVWVETAELNTPIPTPSALNNWLNLEVGQSLMNLDIPNDTVRHHPPPDKRLIRNNGGKNYFILTTPESTDAFNTADPVADRSVIALGNGFLSDYTLEASVGSIPTATAKVDFYNATATIGTTGVAIPGVNLAEGNPAKDYKFSLGHPEVLRGDDQGASPSTGTFGYAALSALRPGDISLELPEELSMFSKISGDGAIHIQNFSLSLPLSRSPIDRLGTRFAFSRVVDLPVVATMSVSALMSDVGEGNLALILDDCKEHDIKVTMRGNKSCVAGDSFDAMIINFRGAKIDSEAISSDIGSNKSIDLTFSTQIGGAGDLLHGVFISGANSNVIPGPHDIYRTEYNSSIEF